MTTTPRLSPTQRAVLERMVPPFLEVEDGADGTDRWFLQPTGTEIDSVVFDTLHDLGYITAIEGWGGYRWEINDAGRAALEASR